MQTLSIDIETFSDVDLIKSGVYAYTASPNFEILLFAYAFDSDEVKIIDFASGEELPAEIIEALLNENIIKSAFNAQFERICLSRHLNKKLTANAWQCTAVQAATLGFPLSLDGVAQVLGLTEQKMKEGKELIRYFSIPCKPTRVNEGRTRNLPQHSSEKWNDFKKYCIRDVEVERAIRKKLSRYPISENEQRNYILDHEINDRGVFVDLDLVARAMECDRLHKEDTFTEAQRLTGLDNPNSVAQLKQWLIENGVEVDSLSKKAVSDLAKEADGEVERLLNLRLQLAKTSIKKYEAIERAVCPDKRVRGLLQFYGANRTGRWAGRLVQVQNLPQNHLKDLTLARNLVKSGDFDTLALLFESVPHVLSELIRTAFIPKSNHRFIVADFSAIEARVIAWLAGEKWRMDVFATHGKIYEASASQMFKVPIEEITKTSALRQKGKISELALGYGGSVGALTAMGALDMGVAEDELQGLVTAWRQANPNITKLWWDIDKAAIKAVKKKTTVMVGKIKLQYESGIMFITLPSGRRLSYIKPRIEPNKFERDAVTYEGIGATKKWERIETYGPKLVENIVQAIARDLLAEAMLRVAENGYEIVMHIHDEIVIEAPLNFGSLKDVCEVMAIAPTWAESLPLRADGFECEYYRKD
ncbi:DNA polymerase [Clostridium cellulovorans]|uniref:DNA-directed DNA polymerase n=1 Tax=Clostridium cellulovorans (strain ATCC 35296 / DSM 3052 / OCM 3 / 743B) TaxID=573061 RepID=D9SSD4_CLOC7|nr:DNA polymerase [Clostridium cellulovorans]ADL50531.1 DNA-directed DNA polymerase [Clostridium cellulovorans 743B]